MKFTLLRSFFAILVLVLSLMLSNLPVFAKEQAKQTETNMSSLAAYQEMGKAFTEQKAKTAEYSEDLNKIAWKNPAPSIEELGLSNEEIDSLVGNRILLMMHKPKTIKVPYYGRMVTWHNARFVTAVTTIPLSAQALEKLIVNNDQHDGWKKVEPMVRATDVLYKDDLGQIGLRYRVQGKISIIRINGDIYARNRYEDNGDISSLFLYGDLGVSLGFVPIIPKPVLSPLSMANVRRWEFIPLDNKHSLVAITDWAEVMNDTDLSRHMSQYDEGSQLGGISDEDLVGPFPGVAMNMYNFKHTVMKMLGELDKSEKHFQKGMVPDFVNTLPMKPLEHLLENGAVVFMHPTQRIDTDYGGYPLHFVTAAYPVNADFKDLRRYSAQMNHYADYVPQLEASDLVAGTLAVPDFSKPINEIPPADVKMVMNLGRRVKFISSFKIEYLMRYFWQSENRLAFEAVSGEIETAMGAVEWRPANEVGKSVLFYTTGSDLGPNPKFPLNLSQKIPGADIASGVIVSVMAAGRQGPWVELQLTDENEDKTH